MAVSSNLAGSRSSMSIASIESRLPYAPARPKGDQDLRSAKGKKARHFPFRQRIGSGRSRLILQRMVWPRTKISPFSRPAAPALAWRL